MNEDFKTPGNYEAIAVSSTAVSLTIAKYMLGHETMALITVETDSIRWRADGEDPTAAEGLLLPAGYSISIAGKMVLNNFKMIRVTGDASVKVQYFHQM